MANFLEKKDSFDEAPSNVLEDGEGSRSSKRLAKVFWVVLGVFLVGVSGVAYLSRPGTLGDPADAYLSAYLVMQDARDEMDAGHFLVGSWSYLVALRKFNAVADAHANWQPAMIDFRRKKVIEMWWEDTKRCFSSSP